nr:MAG TPA: putative tail fiber protein [Caudoviricetes sp.]
MIPDYYYRKRGHIMGFTKKTWKNRIAEYINRRLITMEDGSTNLVTVARDEGTISQEGDAFNAANMNDLEDRIEAGFADVSQSLTTKLSLSSFKVVTLGGNTNLNDISECGIYSVPGGLNAPYGDWSIMMVLPINGDANYVHQICFSLGRARPSARAYAYGSWTDWVEL